MKVGIQKVFDGYIVRVMYIDNSPAYVQGIHKGKIEYTLDYTYARHYKSVKTAEKILDKCLGIIEV